MNPLIITATPNTCWMHPQVDYLKTPEDIAQEALVCLEKGASVYHTHAEGRWTEVISAIRARCDCIIQCGMSSQTLDERIDVFKEGSDMISIILSHHDEAFLEEDFNVLHTKEELVTYAKTCAQYGLVPEFEVWHIGSIWNLQYLIKKDVMNYPVACCGVVH